MAYDITPSNEPPANKGMLSNWAINRISLGVIYSIVSGYYETDANGKPVLNPLGNQEFVKKTEEDTIGTRLNDPDLVACMITALKKNGKALTTALDALTNGKPEDAVPLTIAVFNKMDDIFQATLETHYRTVVLPGRKHGDDPILPETYTKSLDFNTALE